jgi:hypothetical protein
MLAGVRNVVWGGAATVMAGLLAVTIASVWIALFRLEIYILFNPWEGWLDVDDWPYTVSLASSSTEGLVRLAVVVWLIGYTIRRIARSMSSGRPA